jgi:cysteine-rich repeat protein
VGSKCISKCGNGAREDDEECDDNNNENGDGCSDNCRLESGYVCMPLNTVTGGIDVCYCDAKPLSAAWTSYWGTIEINFASTIMYNIEKGPKSSDAKIFCS